MKTTLNPKEEFQRHHPVEAAELAKNRESKWLKVALGYAIVECSAILGLPAQSLHIFSETLLNLAEKEEVIEPLPVQSLGSFDEGAKEASKSQHGNKIKPKRSGRK